MFCKKCGTQLNTGAKFCKKCGTPVTTTSVPTGAIRETQPYQSHQTHQPYQPQQPYQTASTYEQTPALPQAKAVNKRALWIGIAVALVVIAAGYYWYSRAGLERKLEDAISKGNLIRPPGESALDYYRKLKQSGVSESDRKQLEAKLPPVITARPQQMIAEIASPGNRPETTLADWQDAQTLMEWAVEMQPQDNSLAARSSYCAGRVANLSNRKDEAITYWKRAAEQDATWALPLNGIGLIYTERKNYQTARSFLFEAIRREPQFALPYNNIGTSFFYEKDDAQAENYYRQAIERAPQWPRPHAWLGDIAIRRKDYNTAAQEYQTVLDLDPSGTSGIDLNKIKQQLEQARRGIASSSLGDGFTYNDVSGTIGAIKILFSFSVRGESVTGSIRYGNNSERTRLEGNVDGNGFYRLSEFAPDGKYVGSLVFKGSPTNDAMTVYSGTWTRADGQRQLPFKLEPLGD